MTAAKGHALAGTAGHVPAYHDEWVAVYQADCLELLKILEPESVAAVVTDPPYGLAFMGREWDQPWAVTSTGYVGRSDLKLPVYGTNRRRQAAAYQRWCAEWARQSWRALKPGGHLVAFGGARTWHRLAAAIEDAGFELRDTVAWLYGQGFPKSLDISKAIDRRAGAARPIVSRGSPTRRLLPGAEANRATAWRKQGAQWFLPNTSLPVTAAAKQWHGWGTGLKPAFEPIIIARKPVTGSAVGNVLRHGTGALHIDACRVAATGVQLLDHPHGLVDTGRWPPNVVLTHAPACAEGCTRSCPVGQLNAQSGELRSGANPVRRDGPIFRDCYGRFVGQGACEPKRGADRGGASRFFPAFRWQAKAGERPRVGGLAHPTVKPLELMRWLVRLVTPHGGVVLDPFLGSGTTAEAARLEGFRCIGIEREPDYLPLIKQRLARLDGAEDASRRGSPVKTPTAPMRRAVDRPP